MAEEKNTPADTTPVTSADVPPVTDATERHQGNDSGGIGNMVAIGLALIALLMAAYTLYRSPPSGAPGLYVVDTDRLASSYLAGAMQQMKPGDDPQLVQQQMIAKLQQIRTHLSALSDSGVVIVHRSAVLTYPPTADMTAQIAADLDITLLPDGPALSNGSLPPPAPDVVPDGGNGQDSSAAHGASLD